MKRKIGIILLLISIYFFGVGVYNTYKLLSIQHADGFGELAIWMTSVFAFIIGVLFLIVSVYLLKKSSKNKK